MSGLLLFPFRLIVLVAWVLGGLLTIVGVFPLLGLTARQWLIRNWSRGLLACCGVKVECRGRPKREGAVLWVANHISWVDIFVMNRVRAVSFIAKSDIRKWPVLGRLVAGAGTLFIERGRRHAVRAVGHQMAERFSQGEVVGLFPEATTSLGNDVAFFHSSLFEPALRAGVDVQPVALLFRHHGERTSRYAFVGDQTLVHNLWNLLTATGTVVELVFCPIMSGPEGAEIGRVEVAARAQRMVRDIVLEAPAGVERPVPQLAETSVAED